MADKEVKVVIKAVDEATKTISSIAKEIQALANGTGSVARLGKQFQKLGSIFTGLKSGKVLAVACISAVIKGYDKLYQASKKNFTQGLQGIINICGKVVQGLSGVFGGFMGLVSNITGQDLSFSGLTQSALDYEHQMNRVKAVVGANDEQFVALQDKAKALGESTIFTAGQVAQAMEELGQNGMNADQVLSSINGTLDLAVVGGIELSDSAYAVSSALNSFGYTADETERIVDVFTGTALSSGATVEDFGETLSYAGSLAGSLGIPIEEVATLTGLMGNQFVKGSRAGTALRTIMANMAKPTKNMSDVIKEYNLESAQQKIVNGDLVGGMKEMSKKLNGLGQQEKALVATTLAGKYGLAGFLAVINGGESAIDDMTEAIKNSGDASKVAEEFMKSLEGQMYIFASQLQGCAIKIKESIQDSLAYGMKVINTFMEYLLDGKILQGFEYLADESEKWGKALAEGIKTAIAKIFSFIKGGGLDSILQIGTNIIQGICKGIEDSYTSGTLTDTISKIIGKIADWISTNAPRIAEAGRQILDAIKTGIMENEDKIRSAMQGICDIIEMWVSGTTAISSLMGLFADVMVESFIKQTYEKMKGRVNELWLALNQTPVTSKAEDSGLVKGTVDSLEKGKPTITAKGEEIGNLTAESISNALSNMSTLDMFGLNQAMTELANVTEDTSVRMRNAFGVIRNSARDSFVSFANIVRNQMLNITNITRNQMTNTRKAVVEKCISMKKVITTQTSEARNNLTRQMISMRNVTATQMSLILKKVTSTMNTIQQATNRQFRMTLSVDRKVTTSFITKNVTQGLASTMGAIARNTMNLGVPNTMAIASSGVGDNFSSNSNNMYEFSIPLFLDGREVAKATATYNQAELDKLSRRKSRKRGE